MADDQHFYGMKFPVKTMVDYKAKGWAIEATDGGLVIGRSHEEGGIYIWVRRGEHYVLEAEMEGYEYVLNMGASHFFKDFTARFHQYHKHEKLGFDLYTPPLGTTILDTYHPQEPKYLLFETGGFSVMNKYSTRGYLETLDKMNRAVSFEPIRNNQAKLVYHSEEPIEIKFFGKSEGFIRYGNNTP